MKTSNYFMLILFSFFHFSYYNCTKPKEEIQISEEVSTTDSVKQIAGALKRSKVEIEPAEEGFDTVWVKESEKPLLKILSSLPDSAMISWAWSTISRKALYDTATLSHYMLNGKNFNVKAILSDTYFTTQVIDSGWRLKVYKISDDEDLVLVHAGTGDEDIIYAYQYADSKITSIDIEDILPSNYFNLFFKSSPNKTCNTKLDEEFKFLSDYRLYKDDTLLISNDYVKNDSSCYNGNEITLLLNKHIKKFELGDVYWKQPEE